MDSMDSFEISTSSPTIGLNSSSPADDSSEKYSLFELVNIIQNSLQQDEPDLEKIRHALLNYDASLNEWKRFEYWNPKKRYTRNLIATDNSTFTLMLLCWNENQGSLIHNHEGSECFMRTIMGSIQEERYTMPEKEVHSYSQGEVADGMKLLFRSTHEQGKVCFINDSMGMHRIVNPFAEKAVTLHCYIPPYQSCECFDPLTGSHCTGQMVYHTEQGELVNPDA